LSPEQAAEIVAHLPPFTSSVLVTHLSVPEEILPILKVTNTTTVQLHGNTTPDEATHIKTELPFLKTYKAIHVCDESAIKDAGRYVGFVDGIILDTAIRATGQVGGTGRTHDWRISQKVVRSIDLPVILAGGLNPDNVLEAVRFVQPYAVDVNTGVTKPNGEKDHVKLRQFIERAKSG
jgi:phosphoribosylanthranilate isomerase